VSPDIQLASQSPRRRELLTQIGVRYKVVRVYVPERRGPGELARDYVERLALDKARAGLEASPGMPTLGADTIVCCDEDVLEKPLDQNDCVRILTRLSGREHCVMTAIAFCAEGRERVEVSETRVSFREISRQEMTRYWETGEPRDKAGSYAIQGMGAVFVQRLEGSYSGVVGLPIEVVSKVLDESGIAVWKTLDHE